MVLSTADELTGAGGLGEGRQIKRPRFTDPIEEANKRSSASFVEAYMPSDSSWTQWTHPRTGVPYTVRLASSGELSDAALASCFELVEETSGAYYRASSVGWHPALKKQEMRSPDLRYILVEDGTAGIRGFISLMPTFENGQRVVYCYEIHLKPDLQGTGLGTLLIDHLVAVAEKVPSVEKAMLTCFASNARAMRFYERLGFGVDEFSPRERQLRGGKVVKPDYVILSRKTTKRGAGG